MNVIGYIRVSTDEQATNGHGLASQDQAIRAACERRGWTLLDLVAEEGRTASNLDRPVLREVLERIAAGEADGLIVAKLDRLTRSVIDFAVLLDWFSATNAALVALDLDIDTSTPGGRLVANVFAAVAEWERDTISQRTKDGLAALKAQGKPISSPVAPAHIAERIRGMRDQGLTLREICQILNHESVPTARGAAVWRPSAVQGILGYRRPAKRRKVAALPPVR